MACTGRNNFIALIFNPSSRWRWVVRLLMLQPLFDRRKDSWYPLNMRLGWPLNQSKCWVEIKNLQYLELNWTGYPITWSLFPTFISIHYQYIIYLLGCSIGQCVGRNQRRFWQQLQKRKGHRLTSIMDYHHPMQSPLLRPIIQHKLTIMTVRMDLEMPNFHNKTYMKGNWRKTEMFKINPLMPELNRSEQRCLLDVFTGSFKF
jgi:hypothetical protein